MKQKYLKGKTVFIISLIVVGITSLTVYISGINFNRSLTSNLYISLSIIATSLFFFMLYGLYYGIRLIDNFPKFKDFKVSDSMSGNISGVDLPSLEIEDGIGGLIMSILVWIVMSILFVILLIMVEAVFWISLFIILGMLYWIFFSALKFVFKKSAETKGDMANAVLYSLKYTLLYSGWIFLIVYLTKVFK